jgi:3-phosphoshikimate 1-carboxyvinyltransferase
VTEILRSGARVIDVSQCPDLFPVLAVVAAAREGESRFVGVRRLRLKESDRLAAMEELLRGFGVEVAVGGEWFAVKGRGPQFRGGIAVDPRNDHRIAMAAAVAATIAAGPVTILNPGCTAKSYPGFFPQFLALKSF